MTQVKLPPFPFLIALLTLLATLALAVQSAQLQKQNRQALITQHKSFMAEYGAQIVHTMPLQVTAKNPAQSSIAMLAHIDNLDKACVYLQDRLTDSLVKAGVAPCAADLASAYQQRTGGLQTFVPFTDAQSRPGFLLMASQFPPYSSSHINLLNACILLILGLSVWLVIAWYFRSMQQKFGLSSVNELENLCTDLVHHHNYKHRAPNDLPRPLKQIAQAINFMLDDLQHNEIVIQENAIQLQEKSDQLESQKKLHNDRSQNLQKMFAGASHDLRQPLQAMTIFISAIKDGATPEQLPLIQKLEQILDNLNDLFTDLLDISKLESRMQRIPKKAVFIKPLLNKIFDEFEALANEKNIELRLHQLDLTVYSNPNMLERIIRNMISNAIRYTRSGGVLIGSRARSGEVWIEVWDTGRGIPADKMNEIFNEFVQIKEAEQEPNKGVGLGLFIVKKLAQLLDHSIIVKSKLRKGTLFRVIVPIHSSVNTDSTLLHPRLPGYIERAKQNRPVANIVLIDDDVDIRQSLAALLRSWKFNVIDFENISNAQSTLKDNDKIDLIISDFQLGNQQTGLDAIAQIRTILKKSTPAMIISGTDDVELLKTIQNSGFAYLKKPTKPAKLRALINVLISQHKNSVN